MTDTPTKGALRDVVEAAVVEAAARGRPIEDLRSIAFHDSRLDEIFVALNPFQPAVAAVSALPLVKERFGPDQANRLVLQFIYEYLNRVTRAAFAEEAFESVWNAFERELDDPDWTYRGIANIRCFRTEPELLSIGLPDSVTIRGRAFKDLAELGFSSDVLSKVRDDWSSGGHSSFVMVVEEKLKKTPQNLLLVHTPSIWLKAQRAVGSLRLVAPGDISIGPMWVARHAHFDVGHLAVQIGWSILTFGTDYVMTAELASAARDLYEELRQLDERSGYGAAPGNLDLALRSFMATYDRWPPGPDSQLLDSMTALEAALGFDTITEITFKLAFRVAALLARDDSERGAMFEEITGFYDTRSKLVHGKGGLHKDKHQSRLSKVDDLRSVVRRILRSFVHLAVHGTGGYRKQSFQEGFDAKLLSAPEREAIRRALGLA